jgi:hypothetical protein
VTTYPPPSVPVFNAGYGPTQTDLDNWWYNVAGFLQTGVVFRATQTTTATSLPDSGASTLIHFDDVLEDPYSGWDGSTWMWTPPAGYSGWYQATLTVRTVAVGADVDLRPILAGTYGQALATAQGTTAFGAGLSGSFIVYLVGGQDTIGGACELLNSGSAVNTSLTAGQRSTLELVLVSQS